MSDAVGLWGGMNAELKESLKYVGVDESIEEGQETDAVSSEHP